MKEAYLKQVAFLLEILPVLNEFDVFALKGGTAINFFLQNAPRLSVDIDLSYLPIEPRTQFLSRLTNELEKLAQLIQKLGQDILVWFGDTDMLGVQPQVKNSFSVRD